MASKRRSVGELPSGLLILAIVLLTNPLINIFDYLPDFIGYFIIASALSFFAERVPYFDEARGAFLKLGFVSLAKIPSFIIMMRIISQNLRESDIRVLFTFVFAVIEIFLTVSAMNNLFNGLSYLGQRTEASALILPFKISRGKSLSVEGLRILCYVFAGCKGLLNALPEFLLLTNTESELNPGYFNPTLLYPYAISASFVIVFIFGIIFCCISSKYVKAIYNEGKVYSEAEAMIDDARREDLKKRKKDYQQHPKLF